MEIYFDKQIDGRERKRESKKKYYRVLFQLKSGKSVREKEKKAINKIVSYYMNNNEKFSILLDIRHSIKVILCAQKKKKREFFP